MGVHDCGTPSPVTPSLEAIWESWTIPLENEAMTSTTKRAASEVIDLTLSEDDGDCVSTYYPQHIGSGRSVSQAIDLSLSDDDGDV